MTTKEIAAKNWYALLFRRVCVQFMYVCGGGGGRGGGVLCVLFHRWVTRDPDNNPAYLINIPQSPHSSSHIFYSIYVHLYTSGIEVIHTVHVVCELIQLSCNFKEKSFSSELVTFPVTESKKS
jgi:hypothetical protein